MLIACTVLGLTLSRSAILRTPSVRPGALRASWIRSLSSGVSEAGQAVCPLCGPSEARRGLVPRSLELGKDAQHLEHGLAGGGGRIERLLTQEQIDPERVEFGQEANQVLQAAAETIDVPSSDASRLN